MRKLKLLLITIFVFTLSIILGSEIFAANTMKLNITDERLNSGNKYTVITGTTPNVTTHAIFKIIKKDGTTYSDTDALYCLRSGLGFGNTANSESLLEIEDVEYRETYNLKTNAQAVMSYYTSYIDGSSMKNPEYNSILWIIDNMYLPKHKDSQEMKEKLLKKAEIVNSVLTDDDIEFVQQMALWYFTNYDENGKQNSLSLVDTCVLSNITRINEIELTEEKATQIDTLYKYFIINARANYDKYSTTGNIREISPIKPEINVNSSRKNVTTDSDFTVVGPFSITKTSGNVDYALEIQVKDKNGKVIPENVDETPIIYVVKNSTDMTPYVSSIEEAIGQGEFYIKISNRLATEFDLTDINIEAQCEYDKIYKTTATLWLADEEDQQPVLKVEKEEVVEGEFNVIIEKLDENGNLLPGANFSMITPDRQNVINITNNGNGKFNSTAIPITDEGQEFIYDIEEISIPSGYIGINGAIRIKITTKLNSEETAYIIENVEFINSAGEPINISGVTLEFNNNTITIKVVNEKIKNFDLALRKYITKINGREIANTKEPVIDISRLDTYTTAEYAHRKDPVEVVTGDRVTYKVSVYNEGDLYGKVTEIIDYLPEGLEFQADKNPEFIEDKANYSSTELEGKKYKYIYNAATRELRILPIEGTYLFEVKPFNGENLDTYSLEIICTVTATTTTSDKVLTNIATMKYEPSNSDVVDRDSAPNNINLPINTSSWENYKGKTDNKPYLGDHRYFYQGQEDDDDFDKVVIKGVPFDLALRKFISKVNGVEIGTRIPGINTSKLNSVDTVTGKKITTATYTHSKEPVVVKKGDLVTYTIRIYNEGELDGYATEIADHIPEGLGYLIDYKANTDNFWVPVADSTTKTIDLVGEEGVYKTEEAIANLKTDDFYSKTSLRQVKILAGNAILYSTAIDDEIIKAYNPELKTEDIDEDDKWQQSTNGTDGLYYRDVEITCIVLAENTFEGALGNIAEIQEDEAVDQEGDEVNATDRDSNPNNLDLDNYNPPADNSTYQQDDDDYELIELRYFDLALKKFITSVNTEEITNRIPKTSANTEGELEHIKTEENPVNVENSDLITYTLRVYNEGTLPGYAMEISDDIPDGLVFLPEHELNKEYGWVMYDSNKRETTDPQKAVEIRTTYLKNTLLNPYDSTKEINATNPNYADVKVVFQVIEEEMTQSDRIIINKAQITDDKAVDEEGNEIYLEDEDSIPDKWNEGEDDQDIEKIYVKKFDLALLKWVTKTIVTVDGTTTTTETGFTPYDKPEPIAKVVIDKKKINKTTVKFVYNIIVTNQGEIAGYATEITDYIPEGLEFNQEDNPIWTKEGNNKITTRALEGTLLKPGESAIIEVVFTWKKDPDNLGVKTNIAEISEDYNEKGSKDIDSKPDNIELENYDEQQEDDDDKAIVILELKTGGGVTYIWLGLTVLLIIAGGIILIQKFVI